MFALDAKPQVRSLAELAQTRSLGALSAATDQPSSLLLEQTVYPFWRPSCLNGSERRNAQHT